MNFVVDSSFALAWVLKEETTAETDKVLDSLGQGAVHSHLWLRSAR